jgi:hypothetical protein
MADQAERVILEAEDQVSPVVDKANAGLDSFEKKAESSHGKVIRITDQTRSSVQRLIASLEKQAETYGKSGVDRLITQRDQLLQRYNREPQAIDAITRSYEKMIALEEKAAREAAAGKAAKEAEEALRKQSESIKSFGDRVSEFLENPLQGAKGAISSVLSALGPFAIAVTAGAAVLGTIAASEASGDLQLRPAPYSSHPRLPAHRRSARGAGVSGPRRPAHDRAVRPRSRYGEAQSRALHPDEARRRVANLIVRPRRGFMGST